MKTATLIIVMIFTSCSEIVAKPDNRPYAVIFDSESAMSGQVPVVVRISRADAPTNAQTPEEIILTFGMWNQLFVSYDSPVTITASEGLLLKSPCCPLASSHIHVSPPLSISLKPISHEGAQLFISRRCHDAACSVTHSCRA